MDNGLVTFNCQFEREANKESTNTCLSIRTPVSGAVHNHENLVSNDDDKGTDGDDHHECHRSEEHFVVLSCIPQPGGYGEEADAGEELVGSTEEAPDFHESVHAEHDAQEYGKDGGKVWVNHKFLESPFDILRGFAWFKPEFLEHESCQSGGCIQRSEAESGIGEDEEGVHGVFQSAKARDSTNHGSDAAGENVGSPFHMPCFSCIGDGTEGDDCEHTFQKHAAIGDGLCILFFIQLLGSGTGRNERMESGNRAAGNGGEKDGEEVLGTICIMDYKSGVRREKIGVDIRMSTDDADDSHDEHRIEQERGQIVSWLQKDPYRCDGSDGDVKADEPHPGGGGEIERMEIHADVHTESDGSDPHDGGNGHAHVTAVYSKSKDNSYQDEEDGNHGYRSRSGTLRFIQYTIIIDRTKGIGYDGCKGSNDENQGEIGENDKELLGSLTHIGGNDFPDGLAVMTDRGKEGAEVMNAAEENAAYQYPESYREPAEHGSTDRSRNRACAGNR